MAETGAVFGGEHSGHYYFRDNYRADSGSIAALSVLEVMSKAGLPLSELRKPFERYSLSGEINTEVKDPSGTVEAIAELFAKEHRGCTADAHGRAHRGFRRLVVQRPPLQHRAACAAERRGRGRPELSKAHR